MLLCSPWRQQSTQERGTFCSLSPALKNSVYTNASSAGDSKPVTSSGFTHSPNLHVLLVSWIQSYEAHIDKCICMYTSSGGWFRHQLMIPEEFLCSHSSNRMWGEEILMWRITQHQRKKLFPLWFVGGFFRWGCIRGMLAWLGVGVVKPSIPKGWCQLSGFRLK